MERSRNYLGILTMDSLSAANCGVCHETLGPVRQIFVPGNLSQIAAVARVRDSDNIISVLKSLYFPERKKFE